MRRSNRQGCRQRWVIAALLGSVACSTLAVAAESRFDAAHRRGLKANPDSCRFALQVLAAKSRFHVGETIPIALRFSFETPAAFRVARGVWFLEQYRTRLDKFAVDSDGVVPVVAEFDPLRQRTVEFSSVRHKRDFTAIEASLNHWLRFERPGTYHVFCSSDRVVGVEGTAVRLTSNIVTVDIVAASDAWRDEQIRRCSTVLASSRSTFERSAAIDGLRFLDTEKAMRCLADAYNGGEFDAGYDSEPAKIAWILEHSSHRPAIIETLSDKLFRSDFRPNARYLYDLASLAADFPKECPEALSTLSDEQRAYHAESGPGEHYGRKMMTMNGYCNLLWSRRERKDEAARVSSACAIVELGDQTGQGIESSPQRITQLRQMVHDSFLLLEERQQERVLRCCWRRFGGESYASMLEQIIRGWSQKRPRRTLDHDETLLDIALRRLHSVRPDVARRLLIAEIARLDLRVSITTALALPDEPIPELDERLMTRLERAGRLEHPSDWNEFESVVSLVNRYGSSAILERVKKYIEGKSLDFDGVPDAHLGAYLLKHDQPAALSILEHSLELRMYPRRDLLAEVCRLRMNPSLEPTAMRALRNSEPETVDSAVFTLGCINTPDARSALKAHLQQWHLRHREHPEKAGESPDYVSLSPLDVAVVRALDVHSRGDAWAPTNSDRSLDPPFPAHDRPILTRDELTELRAMCLTPEARDEIDARLKALDSPVVIKFTWNPEGEIQTPAWSTTSVNDLAPWKVGYYRAESIASMKALTARFPPGTTFEFPRLRSDSAEYQALLENVRQHVELNGMRLVMAKAR